MIKTICEEAPARPSAADRSLRGDLEIILLKTLEKDREKRYQSVADLSRDIRHYLNREPIEARRPSFASSIGRWTRRHPIWITSGVAGCVGSAVLAGFLISLLYFGYRPYRINRPENSQEAVLVSAAGKVLQTWKSPVADRGFGVADLIETGTAEPKRLVLIGFPSCKEEPHSGELCAFDADSADYKTAVWSNAIKEIDLPDEARNRGFTEGDFFCGAFLGAFEIFPAEPGLELVVSFSHSHSRRALRILSSKSGKTLFQLWHDGPIQSIFWLSKANLLVLGGINDEVSWPARGGPITLSGFSPWVVWALQPELGKRWSKYVCTGQSPDCVDPAWYKCILPPESTDVFKSLRLGRPLLQALDDGETVFLELHYNPPEQPAGGGCAGGWAINKAGKRVEGYWHKSDGYRQIEGRNLLKPIQTFKLGDLPAILPTNEQRAN